MDNDKKLLTGNIFSTLTKFTIPIFLSLVLQALYGAVDLFMVSKFSTTAAISAVSTGSQTLMIVTGLVQGLALGITITLGTAIGENDLKKASKTIGSSFWIFLILSLCLMLILMGGSSLIATWLNAPGKAYNELIKYLIICGGGTFFVVFYNVLYSIFCGLGDSKTPLIIVFIAAIINIILDYLLIEVFKLGASGAAYATIFAQAISVLLSLFFVFKKLPFKLFKDDFKFDKTLGFKVISLGIPLAMLRTTSELSYLLLLGFTNVFGEAVSSGVGIAEKLCMFILLLPNAYMASIATYVAQNMGAKQPLRAKKAFLIGMLSSFVCGSLMAMVSFFKGDLISQIFSNDPEVIKASEAFLKATSLECVMLAIVYPFDGYFNGLGKTTCVMIRGITAALCLRIPYAYFASISKHNSLFNIGFSMVVAAFYMLVFCVIEYLIRSKKEKVNG